MVSAGTDEPSLNFILAFKDPLDPPCRVSSVRVKLKVLFSAFLKFT